MASKKGKGKQPAPQAPQAPQAATTAVASTQLYKVAPGKQYSPRATTLQGNAASWQAVTQYLQANKGTATLQALQAHLAQARNHANFAKYAIRRGWLVAAK